MAATITLPAAGAALATSGGAATRAHAWVGMSIAMGMLIEVRACCRGHNRWQHLRTDHLGINIPALAPLVSHSTCSFILHNENGAPSLGLDVDIGRPDQLLFGRQHAPSRVVGGLHCVCGSVGLCWYWLGGVPRGHRCLTEAWFEGWLNPAQPGQFWCIIDVI